jgi:putative FmdB family regulatory protein
MAWFDYYCEKCDKKFEIQRGISEDRSNVACPDCNGNDVQRIFDSIYLPRKGKSSSGGGFEGDYSGGGGASKCSSCAGGSCSTCG